jgi:hypothetical protein
VNVKLYVEGGGEAAIQDEQCRAGFRMFLEAAGLLRRMPRIVACGGRNAAFEAFKTAMRFQTSNDLPLLLVDSEDAVAVGSDVWQHLRFRDGWDLPLNAVRDQAFLMVRCMETWFLADPSALEVFFGQCFKPNALKAWPSLESVPKLTVFTALDTATSACGKKRYKKGKLSYQILGRISPHLVEAACPHAKRFLDTLRGL